jgi:Kef-type K+ transport system membrane component KefB
MTSTIIITISILVLVAYVFDITAKRTRIPSVLLLLAVGWLGARGAEFLEVGIPDLEGVLPILGTIGLVLIVLEGALDLEIKRDNLGIVRKSLVTAFFPMVVAAGALASVLHFGLGHGFRESLTNALPLCIISSAIAIPTARNLSKNDRDFITFESSLSDIIGVILFNIIATEEAMTAMTGVHFLVQFLVMLVISFVATGLLSFLLSRVAHHVKFTPIIFALILIYSFAKIYHLPALIFVLVFGLFLSNLDELAHLKWIKWLRPEELDREVKKFKEIVVEGTFLVRVMFFLVFGYLIQTEEILNLDTGLWALGIVAGILVLRGLQLKVARLPLLPLLFIAPRGLITVLLFLSIPPALQLPEVSRSLVIQVILLTALVMMGGMIVGGGVRKVLVAEEADVPETEAAEGVQEA